MKRSPTAPNTVPSKKVTERSVTLYIRRLLTDVIPGRLDEISQGDLISIAAGTAPAPDYVVAQQADEFGATVIPSIDKHVAEVGH